jgi:hypothetical protein
MTLPVRYTPTAPVQGAAYGTFFKGLLTSAVCLIVVGFLKAYGSGALAPKVAGADTQVSGALVWFIAALLIILVYYVYLMMSVSKIDEKAIEQTWIWQKRVELNQLVYAKMMRIQHLDWIFAPRLYVQTAAGKRLFFYCADPALLAEFEAVAKAYSTPV